MNANKIGPVIKAARDKKGINRLKAAKLVRISLSYFGLLETSFPVYLSDEVRARLESRLGVKGLKPRQEAHNRRARARGRALARAAKAPKKAGRK